MPYNKRKTLKRKVSYRKKNLKPKKNSKKKMPKSLRKKRSKGGFVRDGSVQQFVLQYCL